MEGDGVTQIRLAVNDDYDTILFAEFDSSVVDSRILEDDTITIRGLSTGLITYDSTMGGSIFHSWCYYWTDWAIKKSRLIKYETPCISKLSLLSQ